MVAGYASEYPETKSIVVAPCSLCNFGLPLCYRANMAEIDFGL